MPLFRGHTASYLGQGEQENPGILSYEAPWGLFNAQN
jgi:hypothetical protein